MTITLTGPADVWFGVGFDAEEMASAPYAVVVDGAGNVSEHKLGNHAPGIVLQPSVALVSSTVSGVSVLSACPPPPKLSIQGTRAYLVWSIEHVLILGCVLCVYP